ncbi:MAG: DNA polymerase IV [Spirosomataceae bacterium]
MAPAPRKIIHIDMDAFYASVEQRDNPDLRGKPVAVGGNSERGVVAAASYEARVYGVRSAMSSRLAKRRCPMLVFVRPRFDVYKAVSQQIRAIFSEYTHLIEPLSLDEAYLDVTENRMNIPTATQIAQEIKAKIKEQTQLTASAGVSYNKFLAKLASDYRKPDGLFVIKPHQGEKFVESLEVGKFHGIGRVTAQKMNRLGIFTGADLKKFEESFLTQHFGKVGQFYYHIARGVDNRPVSADRARKSYGSENTFAQDLTDITRLETEVRLLVADVWRGLSRIQLYGRTVTLKVKYFDFEQHTRSRTTSLLINTEAFLENIALELLYGLQPMPKAVRLLGVSVSNFESGVEVEGRQLTLEF